MKLLSLRAASRILHVDHRTLLKAIVDGTCPARKFGKRWKIEEEALRRWIAGSSTTLNDKAVQ